jgi:hypothetical protein
MKRRSPATSAETAVDFRRRLHRCPQFPTRGRIADYLAVKEVAVVEVVEEPKRYRLPCQRWRMVVYGPLHLLGCSQALFVAASG